MVRNYILFAMAEGGYENPSFDPYVDPDDLDNYDDNNDDKGQDPNETQPF